MSQNEAGSAPEASIRRQVLMRVRVIWASLLMGEVVFAALLASLMADLERASLENGQVWTWFAVGMALLGVMVPGGLFARGQVFKRFWREEVVTPRGYLMGTIVAVAMAESVVMFSLITCLLVGWWPMIVPGGLAFLVQLALWPNGRAMWPRETWENR